MSKTLSTESGGHNADEDDRQLFAPADYVMVMPMTLDQFGEVTPKSYSRRVDLIRNLLAAKLKVSWFSSADTRKVYIRASADQGRLVSEAERIQLLMRKQAPSPSI